MIPISLTQLATLTQGALKQIDTKKAQSIWCSTVTTNSRERSRNNLFIALNGYQFDGHNFAYEAAAAGANALLVERLLPIYCPQVIVKDTHLAIGQLAAWIRKKTKAKVIGLTGSSGKTSVKEMVAAILAPCGATLFTEGNLNNDIGVPLTLLRLEEEHQYAVIEMGANHIGEIAYTTNIVRPDIVLVNNLFSSHLEGFGSLSGVAKAKGEIFQGLAEPGIGIINLCSHDWKNWKSYFTQKQSILRFSLTKHKKADFYAENIIIQSICSEFDMHTPQGVISIFLPLPGIHNIANAIAASALAISVGATLDQISLRLAHIQPITGRLYPIYLAPGKVILDDTYNANIGSMIAAANVLSKMPGYRILVVSDIGELGNQTEKCHQAVGVATRTMKLDQVLSVGQYSINISQHSSNGEHLSSKEALIKKLISLIKKHKTVSVLVKGSRNTKMEEVVNALQEFFLC
ncbi:MAG: UDP-N-acetylmuramoyl-tripeptide--D-alanyl-D-alanine ligase [Candidatus Arsenophonus melophagi]|nr:UDP-N-acetylmuramoyl-tripeptide--D-alanyl-D-alanine ligase [Candidatus Arsenophonus melophagi]